MMPVLSQVLSLFELFACFPEDVAVPTELFDRLAAAAPALFQMREGTRRPHLLVRSCAQREEHGVH